MTAVIYARYSSDNQREESIEGQIRECTAYAEKNGVASSHHTVVTDDKRSVGKVLPWVHIVISNVKRSILDTYHDIKAEFLQLYLNEFCYKFNRRYFGCRLFDRLELCACSYRADFKHRIY